MKKQESRLKLGPMFLLLIAFMLLATGCVAGSKQDEDIQTISVTGYGQASGKPDMATVQLGVTIVNQDLGLAIEEANRTSKTITDALTANGVSEEDVLTSNYNLWREDIYDRETGAPTDEARYHVDINLEVTIKDVDRMGELINVGLEAGVNNIYGISFSLENTASLELEARAEALTDVRNRALTLAQGLNMELGDPLSISENFAGAMGPTYSIGLKGDGGMGGGGQPLPISPGKTTVTMQLFATYELIP